MESEFVILADRVCPICGQKIKVNKTKSRLIKVKQDDDFCCYYNNFNPYFYSVWVCYHCGYAADEKNFGALMERDKQKIAEFLKDKEINLQHKAIYTLSDAIAHYKLALYYMELINAPASRLAGMYLRLGWIYRQSDMPEQEKVAIERAIAAYDESLATERYPIGAMTDNTVTYLIGVLHLRIGNMDKATMYISRVIGDPRARQESNIYNKARDVWQLIKTQKEAEEAANAGAANGK